MGCSPFSAHFDTWESCRIARRDLHLHELRQNELRSLYSQKKANLFEKGDRVLMRTKRHNFHKYSPISYPTFSKAVYTIKTVHDQVYPPVFSLSPSPGGDERRRFYGFELFKVDPAYDSIKKRNNEANKNKIFVEDVRFEQPSKLRSGRVLPGKAKPIYTVWQNGKRDTVPAKSLDLWKAVLGDDVLVYSDNFGDLQKVGYKI